MGQGIQPGAWCGENQLVSNDIMDWATSLPVGRSRSRGAPSVLEEPEADRLLTDCPRELAETLKGTRQWDALRCRPWLSASAFRSLHRSLQRCQLPKLIERFREAETPEESSYALPPVIPWVELDADHVISAGQVFKCEDASHSKLWQLRRLGLTVLRQGKVGVVLLAGGANLRLGGGEAPVGCSKKMLQLLSGKSILQLVCERIRRIALLARGPEDHLNNKSHAPRPSIPVFIMTSKLTHRAVVDHLESNQYFGLLSRDVFFFEQSVFPVLGENGRLLPQSLGGEFAHAPGGTGEMLKALANSSALEQMRDRGVECLHVIGLENVLARVCDPIFIGFCRELDVDCACKITNRNDAYEDLELFCIRQSPVSTQYADIEEAACGAETADAPPEVLEERTQSNDALAYSASINSTFFTVTYIEEVVGRPIRGHRVMRILPYLDFHTTPETADGSTNPLPLHAEEKPTSVSPVALGSWPAETPSADLACQRALLQAAAEVRAVCRPQPGDSHEAWRCDVDLDCNGPMAVVRVRSAARGPALLPYSIAPRRSNGIGYGDPERPVYEHLPTEEEMLGLPLRCSLVVPSKANAFVLEISLLDYFAYTDRVVALDVKRDREFAPVCEGTGPHSPEVARQLLQNTHRAWLIGAGAKPEDFSSEGASVEVSPLLSYEGEGLGQKGVGLQFPCHLLGSEEVAAQEDPTDPSNAETDVGDGLDTRLFYLQEYPQRLQMSSSHTPQFRSNSRSLESPQKSEAAVDASSLAGIDENSDRPLPLPLLWQDALGFPSATALPGPLSSAAQALQSSLSRRFPQR